MDWLHLSAPGPEFEATWPAHSAEVRRRLDRSENIVVHCHGGLGRAGMIAVRLLGECGLDPDAAIDRVREARPRGDRDGGRAGPLPEIGSIQSRSGPKLAEGDPARTRSSISAFTKRSRAAGAEPPGRAIPLVLFVGSCDKKAHSTEIKPAASNVEIIGKF